MAFGSLQPGSRGSQTLSEINMVPLIDVMLVLLVIFMITAPLLSHSVRVDLPQTSSQPAAQAPETVSVAVDAQGQWHWNDEPVLWPELQRRLQGLGQQAPQTTLQLRADRNTRYELLAEVMAAASRSGIKGIGFVTLPADTP